VPSFVYISLQKGALSLLLDLNLFWLIWQNCIWDTIVYQVALTVSINILVDPASVFAVVPDIFDTSCIKNSV